MSQSRGMKQNGSLLNLAEVNTTAETPPLDDIYAFRSFTTSTNINLDGLSMSLFTQLANRFRLVRASPSPFSLSNINNNVGSNLVSQKFYTAAIVNLLTFFSRSSFVVIG